MHHNALGETIRLTMESDRKGFKWFKRAEVRSETPVVQQGSVDSAGGTSPLPGIIPPDRDTLGAVTVEEAMSIPAVGAAIRKIYTSVSQLDLKVYRQGIEIDSPLASRPDGDRSASAFFKRTAIDLSTTGNTYWRLFRNSQGLVTDMKCLEPSRVTIWHDERGRKFYDYTDHQGKTQTFSNNNPRTNTGQVEHIRLGEHEGHLYGRGPIQVHNRALRNILVMENYLEKFLTEWKRPSQIWTTDQMLDPQEVAQLKVDIVTSWLNGEPTVAYGGLKADSLMPTPETAQLIEVRRAAQVDVANMFDMPAALVNAGIQGSAMTYTNMLTLDMQFVRYGLEEYLTPIEDAFTNVLPNGQTSEFDTDGWLRASIVLAGTAAQATTPKEAAPIGGTEQNEWMNK